MKTTRQTIVRKYGKWPMRGTGWQLYLGRLPVKQRLRGKNAGYYLIINLGRFPRGVAREFCARCRGKRGERYCGQNDQDGIEGMPQPQ
jgi:hypothetical protein